MNDAAIEGRLAALREWTQRVATIGAWAFAIGTLGTLLFITWARWPGTNSESHILSRSVNGRDYTGLGLRYVGIAGTVLAILESVVVLSGLVMSVLHGTLVRRIGHGLLVAWGALWLGNVTYLAQAAGVGGIWPVVILVLALCFLCTVYRAVRGWRPRPSA